MENRCVCCGDIIPEGMMVCRKCIGRRIPDNVGRCRDELHNTPEIRKQYSKDDIKNILTEIAKDAVNNSLIKLSPNEEYISGAKSAGLRVAMHCKSLARKYGIELDLEDIIHEGN